MLLFNFVSNPKQCCQHYLQFHLQLETSLAHKQTHTYTHPQLNRISIIKTKKFIQTAMKEKEKSNLLWKKNYKKKRRKNSICATLPSLFIDLLWNNSWSQFRVDIVFGFFVCLWNNRTEQYKPAVELRSQIEKHLKQE